MEAIYLVVLAGLAVVALAVVALGSLAFAAVVVLKFQKSLSLPREMAARAGAKSAVEYAALAHADTMAAGRAEPDGQEKAGDSPTQEFSIPSHLLDGRIPVR